MGASWFVLTAWLAVNGNTDDASDPLQPGPIYPTLGPQHLDVPLSRPSPVRSQSPLLLAVGVPALGLMHTTRVVLVGPQLGKVTSWLLG